MSSPSVERGQHGDRIVLLHADGVVPEREWPAQLELDARYRLALTPAHDPAGVLRALAGRAHLVAGGQAAAAGLAAARDAPDRVRSLCLVEPPLAALTAGLPDPSVPLLVVTGGWNEEREGVAEALVERAGAEHVILLRHGARPQDAGRPFNARLEQLWADAAAARR